jgi:hypothetical protein
MNNLFEIVFGVFVGTFLAIGLTLFILRLW